MPPIGMWVRTTIGIDRYERAVRDVDLCAFDKKQCRALLKWDRLRRGQTWEHHRARWIIISPAAPGLGPSKARHHRRKESIGIGHGDLTYQVENAERCALPAPATKLDRRITLDNGHAWLKSLCVTLASHPGLSRSLCRAIPDLCALLILRSSPEKVHHHVNSAGSFRVLRLSPFG